MPEETHGMWRFHLVGLAVWATSASSFFSSQLSDPRQLPKFRSGVEVVEVDVVAVDGAGHTVNDLRQEEFQVYESNRRRDVVAFAHVSLPIPQPHSPASVDVRTNAASEDARVMFLVLDDANSSRNSSEGIRTTVRELLSRLAPQDQVGLLWVSLKKEGAHELTSNHAAILDGIADFKGGVTTIERRHSSLFGRSPDIASPPQTADEASAQRASPVPSGVPEDVKQFFDRLRPFKIVRDVSRSLASLPQRRKAIVYVGEALQALGPSPLRTGVNAYADIDLREALTAARRANVSVYLLDPRHPLRPGAEGLFEEPVPRMVERLWAADLPALAGATGGFAATSPILHREIDRIVTEMSSYYVLGYYSDPAPEASALRRIRTWADAWAAFRPIEVRTTRPGVRVRARKGYWPTEGSKSSAKGSSNPPKDPVFAAVSGLLPQSSLQLRASATPLRKRRETSEVMVAVELRDDALRGAGIEFEDTLTGVFVAFAPGQKVRLTKRVKARIALPADKTQALATGRYLLCADLPLSPGRYQLRVGVGSATASKTGSVYVDVTVPDFRERSVSLGGIIVQRGTGGAPTAVARTEPTACPEALLPSLDRHFATTDLASAVLHVYRAKAGVPAVTLTATIQSRSNESTVWSTSHPVSFGAENQAVTRVPLPLDTLSPGSYRLAIDVRTRDGAASDHRDLDFEVE